MNNLTVQGLGRMGQYGPGGVLSWPELQQYVLSRHPGPRYGYPLASQAARKMAAERASQAAAAKVAKQKAAAAAIRRGKP
jgi:hypothetical protein